MLSLFVSYFIIFTNRSLNLKISLDTMIRCINFRSIAPTLYGCNLWLSVRKDIFIVSLIF